MLIKSSNRDQVVDSHHEETQHTDRTNQQLDLASQATDMGRIGSQHHDLTSKLHGVHPRDLPNERSIDQLGKQSQLSDANNQHCNIVSLASSLSINSPAMSVATMASASSSVSTHEESSQRHFQHTSPRERQVTHISKVYFFVLDFFDQGRKCLADLI